MDTKWRELGGQKKVGAEYSQKMDREVLCDFLRLRIDRRQEDSHVRVGQMICRGQNRESVHMPAVEEDSERAL